MKIVRFIALELLLLLALLLCGAATVKLLDVLFQLGNESIWASGFGVGFIAWLVLLVITIFVKTKKKQK